VPSIVIIGGGASGTLTAAHLLSDRRTGHRDITLIERGAWVQRGIAYRTTCPAHLLNVPAANMSAFPDDPTHFLTWASRRVPGTTPGSFLPRQLFGDYLSCVLTQAEHAARPHAHLRRMAGEVIDVIPRVEDAVVVLADGRRLEADAVVLALGTFPPAPPPGAPARFLSDRRYVADPWAPDAFGHLDADAEVLLIGTGLTAVDVALALRERGHRGRMHAISRRGLLPRAHLPGLPAAQPWLPTAVTTRGMLAELRNQVRSVESDGGDWRQVIDSLRGATPHLWARLSDDERRRFARHAARYWDAHRHRMAPAVAHEMTLLQWSGQLSVSAGRLSGFAAAADHLRVQIGRHHATETISVGGVINCTGPQTDVRAVGDPLLNRLMERASVRPDGLQLGLDTTVEGEVTDRSGSVSGVLWTVGALRKGQAWESTAIPEIRQQTSSLARRLGDAAWRPAHVRAQEVATTQTPS
jgi:uncharacterized NAD(P)/FAD-binding protein YdhS